LEKVRSRKKDVRKTRAALSYHVVGARRKQLLHGSLPELVLFSPRRSTSFLRDLAIPWPENGLPSRCCSLTPRETDSLRTKAVPVSSSERRLREPEALSLLHRHVRTCVTASLRWPGPCVPCGRRGRGQSAGALSLHARSAQDQQVRTSPRASDGERAGPEQGLQTRRVLVLRRGCAP